MTGSTGHTTAAGGSADAANDGTTPARASQRLAPWPHGRATALSGELVCPPDKSITHRSVMFAAMASGESRIEQPLLGADCLSTMAAMRALGVGIAATAGNVTVRSPGWDKWQAPLGPLDYGNSGTTARLLTGIFASSPHLFVTAFGDASLSGRPMARVVEPLRRMGAQIAGRAKGHLLPHAVTGQVLTPCHHEVDKASAQVKSAIMLAGLNCTGATSVKLPVGGRDHTEKMLQALGAGVEITRTGTWETITVHGPFRPPPRVYAVPGDPSSAAFFAVLAAISGSDGTGGRIIIRRVLDNATRTGFLRLLERMGAGLSYSAPSTSGGLLEPVTDITITAGAALRAVDMEAALAPTLIDEIPVLAVAAACAAGTSRFRGLGELRVKESDRLGKTTELLTLAGVKAWTEGDDLLVHGSLLDGVKARAFTYDPAEDHRLAMAAAVLARVANGPCTIFDPDCTAVSFPGFFQALAAFG